MEFLKTSSQSRRRFFRARAACLAVWSVANAADAPAPPADQSAALLNRLNEVLQWYRQEQASDQWVFQPRDVFFSNTQHQLAVEVLQEAFASAKAQAPLAEVKGATKNGQPAANRARRPAH